MTTAEKLAALGPRMSVGRCGSCGEAHHLIDGLCWECRRWAEDTRRDIRQMLADWNDATPAQRAEALRAADKMAATA